MPASIKLNAFLRDSQTVPRLLVTGLALALALLASLGILSYRNLQRQGTAADWVAHTYQVAVGLQTVYASVQDAESAQRAFAVSGTEAYLAPLERASANLPAQIDAVTRLTADNPARAAQVRTLRADIDKKMNMVRQRIDERRRLGLAALDPKYLNGAGVRLMDVVRSDTDTMIGEENQLLKNRLQLLAHVRARSVLLQVLGGACSFVLLTAVFISLVKQMSRANRAEQESQHSNAQLTDANNDLRAFSYSVAHDLRAPLRAIHGFAHVIVEDHAAALNEEGRRMLGRITTNAKMMSQLIDDLLSLSKITYQPLQTSKVDMDALARAVYAELLETEGGRVIQCEIGELPPASGDPALLRQVWLNLIGNALKFTRERKSAHIEIGGTVAGPEFATYFIRDNGAGFDMQYADKLFGAFQRLHGSEKFEGTGIGLALVHRIIQRHGGTIWAEGQENDGARFAFTLPEWAGE